MAKSVVPKQQQLPGITDLMDRMREQAGAGLDTIGAQDLLIPRLTILQGLSPQVTQGRPEFDPNARVGQIYDVGLREAFPGGVRIVIAHYTKVWNEWFPRAGGNKGIVRAHTSNAVLANTRPGENNKPTLPNGNVIEETAEFYALNITARGRKTFIPMTVTQLKEAKRINTYITSEEVTDAQGKTFRPPIFYRTYDLTTVPSTNAKGTWMSWKVERGPLLSEIEGAERLFDEALRFRAAITGGHVRGDMTEEATAESDNVPWNENGKQGRRNEGPL